MRGVAALYVLLSHVANMVDPHWALARPGAEPAWLAAILAPFRYGHLAVAAFIVISGYCLQHSLYAGGGRGRIRDLGKFFRRRCWRILPPYYACLGLSVLVAVHVTSLQAGLPWKQYLPVTTENVLAHVFLIHNLNPDWMYKINGVLWSISIEFQLYLLFPFLVAILARNGALRLLAATASVAAVGFYGLEQGPKLYIWYLPLFALGMATAKLAHHPNGAPWRPLLWALTVGGLAATIEVCQATKSLLARDAMVAAPVALLLLLGATHPRDLFARQFSWPPLVALGGFSYSLYLMHHPILQIATVARPGFVEGPIPLAAWLATVGAMAALLGCYVFHLAFERPFIGRGKARGPADRISLA